MLWFGSTEGTRSRPGAVAAPRECRSRLSPFSPYSLVLQRRVDTGIKLGNMTGYATCLFWRFPVHMGSRTGTLRCSIRDRPGRPWERGRIRQRDAGIALRPTCPHPGSCAPQPVPGRLVLSLCGSRRPVQSSATGQPAPGPRPRPSVVVQHADVVVQRQDVDVVVRPSRLHVPQTQPSRLHVPQRQPSRLPDPDLVPRSASHCTSRTSSPGASGVHSFHAHPFAE